MWVSGTGRTSPPARNNGWEKPSLNFAPLWTPAACWGNVSAWRLPLALPDGTGISQLTSHAVDNMAVMPLRLYGCG